MKTLDAWKRHTLKEVAALNYGKDLSAIVDIAGNIPIHGTSEDVRWGRDYLYDGASVILGRKGSIDRVKYVEGKFWTIDTAYYLSDFKEAVPKWLYYFLSSLDLRALNEATGVPSLSRDRLYMIELSKPPLPEQSKIAEILSTVDRAIEQTEALIAKQQRIKTGLMADLLTRGIDAHGNLRFEETHAFKDSPLGRIPVVWDPSSLGKLAQFNSGYAFKNEELTEHGWQVVRISNLHKPDFPYWHYEGPVKEAWKIKDGDILFSWAGVASSIDCVRYRGPDALMNQHIYNLVFDSESLRSFVYYYLQRYLPVLRTEIEGGAGQLHLTKSKIQSIGIPALGDDEMERVLEILNEHEQQITDSKKMLSKLRALKTALMQDLLTGKVRVAPLLKKEVPA